MNIENQIIFFSIGIFLCRISIIIFMVSMFYMILYGIYFNLSPYTYFKMENLLIKLGIKKPSYKYFKLRGKDYKNYLYRVGYEKIARMVYSNRRNIKWTEIEEVDGCNLVLRGIKCKVLREISKKEMHFVYPYAIKTPRNKGRESEKVNWI
jgi:hypothetical protein